MRSPYPATVEDACAQESGDLSGDGLLGDTGRPGQIVERMFPIGMKEEAPQ